MLPSLRPYILAVENQCFTGAFLPCFSQAVLVPKLEMKFHEVSCAHFLLDIEALKWPNIISFAKPIVIASRHYTRIC